VESGSSKGNSPCRVVIRQISTITQKGGKILREEEKRMMAAFRSSSGCWVLSFFRKLAYYLSNALHLEVGIGSKAAPPQSRDLLRESADREDKTSYIPSSFGPSKNDRNQGG